MMHIFTKFAALLQRKLNEKGWSQVRLANETGLSTSTVSDYYHGCTVPRLDRLVSIAIELEYSLEEFKQVLELPELLYPVQEEDKYDYEKALKLFLKRCHSHTSQ